MKTEAQECDSRLGLPEKEETQSENKKSNSAVRIELPAKDNPKLKREDPVL